MTQLVEPRPEFLALTEAEIMAALQDHDPGNPIACELARLIAGYTENFRAHVERLGRIPEEILHVAPGSPIEAVAMRLTTEAITDTISQQRSR